MMQREFDRMLQGAPETREGMVRAEYRLCPDFIGFAGHFDGYPLMPAFVQALMAEHALNKAGLAAGTFAGMPSAKFTGQAKPGDTLRVACSRVAGGGPDSRECAWDCQITKSADDGPVARFRLLYSGA